MLDLQNVDFKSLDELKEVAPSIFSKVPSSNVTEKYTHIPTDQVIRDMELLGWGVVDAKEVNARTKDTKGFQKHLVVFRNPDVVINGEDGDTVYPQVLLTNSHDGKNAFTFTAGLYRMVCENGLVVADTEFEDFKVRHMGYDFETLQDTIKDIIGNLDLTIDSMNKMKETELSEKQMFDLAKSFLDIRIEGSLASYTEEAINDVLEPQRKEDKGSGLWEVFNRVQENIIEGNFQYHVGKGTPRQARIIKNFKQDQVLNKKMFSKALEFVA
tara:strand:- start:2513 stop:3322 length:810 start_codon:yes stop_codon:yes gene_type:complete